MNRPLSRFAQTLLFVLFLSVPLTGLAESFATRGAFIQAAVSALAITPTEKGTLPYKRIPAQQRGAVQAAYNKGALNAFGSGELLPGRAITKGEAIQVLVKLSGLTPSGAMQKFTDVPSGSALASAATVAMEQGWIKPVRKTVFGADRPLSEMDVKVLLRKAQQTLGTSPQPIIRVKVKPSTVEGTQDKVQSAIRDLLQKQYLYKERIDPAKATGTGADALVKTLNDPYTVYMPPAENKQFQEQIAGEITGIGVQIEYRDTGLLIVAPLPNSPAEKAGLKGGDLITAVNDVILKGLSYQDAVMKVRGPRGTTATLTILRDGQEMTVPVTRDTVKVPEVELSMKGSIAVVKIGQFGDTTDMSIRATFSQVQESKPRALIIDLRNNPGGLLHAADVLMSAFIPKGSVVANIHSRDGIYTETTDTDPIFSEDLPVMLLVNKGSASASEIVAGAFQDYKRATLIGETTFGKGTVQQLVEFKDGSSLKMTIAEWKTPKDRKIDGIGVIPDIAVDSTSAPDAAMAKALELLRY